MKKTLLIISLLLTIIIGLHNYNDFFIKTFIENTDSSSQQTFEKDCAVLIDKEVIITVNYYTFFPSNSFPLTVSRNQIWKPPDNI